MVNNHIMNALNWRKPGRLVSGLLIFCLVIFVFSCKDDPKDEEVPATPPWGLWTHTFTGTTPITAELQLREAEGKYVWVVLDTVSGIGNDIGSVVVSDNQAGFYNNGNCWETGIYEFTVKNNILNFSMVSDSCPGRMEKLKTAWIPKQMAGLEALSGSWQKMMSVGGVDYRVRLTMTVYGNLNWEMIDPIPGHTNSSVSFTATDSTIVIYKDTDCPGNGYYNWSISGNELTICLLKDYCPPRAPSFSGVWTKP